MSDTEDFITLKAAEKPYNEDIEAKVAFFRKHLEAATPEDVSENGHILWMVLFNEHFYLDLESETVRP